MCNFNIWVIIWCQKRIHHVEAMDKTFILTPSWRRSGQYKSVLRGRFWGSQIFPNKVRIVSSSSNGQKSYCQRTLYQKSHFISQQFTWKVGRGNVQICTDLTSNAKYADMLHPHASKQYSPKIYSITHKSLCPSSIYEPGYILKCWSCGPTFFSVILFGNNFKRPFIFLDKYSPNPNWYPHNESMTFFYVEAINWMCA